MINQAAIEEDSRLVTKYGRWPTYPSRTGFTPINLFPSYARTQADWDLIVAAEVSQRQSFHGFTTRELADLDAFPDRELLPGNLDNAIMRVLWPDRWEVKPANPQFTRRDEDLYDCVVRGEIKGKWVMENEEIWGIMQRPLQLATRIFMSAYVLPWFDAVLNGVRTPIDPSRIKPEDIGNDSIFTTDIFSIEPTTVIGVERLLAAKRDELLDDLMTKWDLTFGFSSSEHDPRGPEFRPTDAYGVCFTNYFQMKVAGGTKWGIWIFLNFSCLESLFRDDLTSSERMMIEWQTAITIVHELMHAIGKIAADPRTPRPLVEPVDVEPYIGQEAYNEIGHSYEAALDGGTVSSFLSSNTGFPLGHWLETQWPCIGQDSFCRVDTARLINPSAATFQDRYPIPVTLYQDMQQESFWELAVRTFGHGLFHYRTRNEGVRIDYAAPREFNFLSSKSPETRLSGIAPYPAISTAVQLRVSELKQMMDMSPDQRIAFEFARRFFLSSAIEGSFWNSAAAQRRGVDALLEQVVSTPDQSTINLLSDVSANHKAMIADLRRAEYLNGAPFTNRRAALLDWNRKTIAFCNEVTIRLPPTLASGLVTQAIELEKCRMKIWVPSPAELSHNGPDTRETLLLKQLLEQTTSEQGIDQNACMRVIANLIGAKSVSLLARVCARTVENEMMSLDLLTQGPRILDSLENLRILKDLESESEGEWILFVGLWVTIAERVVRDCGGMVPA